MDTHYTEEKHIRILIALLKAKGIKKVVASPGTTNVTFVASIQSDPFFEIYSSVDERSAAYIVSGLLQKAGKPLSLHVRVLQLVAITIQGLQRLITGGFLFLQLRQVRS